MARNDGEEKRATIDSRKKAAEVADHPANANRISAHIARDALTALLTALKEDGRLLCGAAAFALAAVIVYRLVLHFGVTR